MERETIVLTVKQNEMFDQISNAGERGWYIGSCQANASSIRIANALVRKGVVSGDSMLLGYLYRVKTWKDAQP